MKNTMFKTIILLLFMGMASLTAMGKPADAKNVREGMTFNLEDVDVLLAGSDWDVTIIEGTTPELRIDQAQDRKGWVRYNGKELELGVEAKIGISWGFRRHKATLILPYLPENLKTSSSSSIHIPGKYNPENLEIGSSSSSRIYLGTIQTDQVTVRASSSSRVEWEELICRDMEVYLSSSSRVFAEGGESENLTSRLSSSSRFLGENFLITRNFSIQGSSSSRMELALTEETQVSGNLSSSSRVVAYSDPPPSLWEIETSSSAGVSAE